MCSPAFDPQRIIGKLLAGEWPQYEELFEKHIERKQSRVIQLAEGLRALQMLEGARGRRDNPVTKHIERRALSFLEENNKVLRQNQNQAAYFRALQRAGALLNTGEIKWRLSVRGLIILARIYLVEEAQKPTTNTRTLREIVTPHHLIKGRPASISDNFWRRNLAHPDIVGLLSSRQQRRS